MPKFSVRFHDLTVPGSRPAKLETFHGPDAEQIATREAESLASAFETTIATRLEEPFHIVIHGGEAGIDITHSPSGVARYHYEVVNEDRIEAYRARMYMQGMGV